LKVVKKGGIILLLICCSGLGISIGNGKSSSMEWALSVGDTLVYSIVESKDKKWDDNRSVDLTVWKKETTSWGTERIWINGSIPGEFQDHFPVGLSRTSMQFDLCLDSVTGSTQSSLNNSIFTQSYLSFNPLAAFILYDPVLYIVPINSPRFNWSPSLTFSNVTESRNSSGHLDDSVTYVRDNRKASAIKITAYEEETLIDSNLSFFRKIKSEESYWYSTQWGVLLDHKYFYEICTEISNSTSYTNFTFTHRLQDSSIEVFESSVVPWSSPFMILAVLVIYLTKKKTGKR
jgi:hypothetical protein